ncbi:MAG: hypothetical protein VX223_09375 [Myxococcota bacterium]|nr:hypothetical protein [Myxococcota bacterium]
MNRATALWTMLAFGILSAASADRAVLYVAGAVPQSTIATSNAPLIVQTLGLVAWPATDNATEKAAVDAFIACRKALYEEGDTSAAGLALSRAKTLLSRTFERGQYAAQILEGLWLGIHLHLIAGQSDAARELAVLSLRLHSDRTPPESGYSPRVRRLVAKVSQQQSPPLIVGKPMDCDLASAGSIHTDMLLPGEYIWGLRCNGQTQPAFGRRVDWDGRSTVDVSSLALWLVDAHIAVAESSVLGVAAVLLQSHQFDEVVVIRASATGMWSAVRHTKAGMSSSAPALSEADLIQWIVQPEQAELRSNGTVTHRGTYWGIGLAGTGFGLLAAALGTRALANDATDMTNRGFENRLDDVNTLQAATWSLVGTGAALSVVGIVVALTYGLRNDRSEGAGSSRGTRPTSAFRTSGLFRF